MIFHEKPEDFKPVFEIVSCFVEKDGKFLFLQRLENKSEGNKWGVPAGKIDKGESKEDALIREIKEETGYDFSENVPLYFGKVFVRYPEKDFVYHIASAKLHINSEPSLNPLEHKEHAWLSPEEALKLDLIRDEDSCIKLFFDL